MTTSDRALVLIQCATEYQRAATYFAQARACPWWRPLFWLACMIQADRHRSAGQARLAERCMGTQHTHTCLRAEVDE